MKGIVGIFMLLTLVTVIAAPLSAQAAGKKSKSEVMMKIGKKIHLFHSGTADVKKEIALNDVIPVYRQTGKTAQLKEVGQVKVLSFIDDHHFEAKIIASRGFIGHYLEE